MIGNTTIAITYSGSRLKLLLDAFEKSVSASKESILRLTLCKKNALIINAHTFVDKKNVCFVKNARIFFQQFHVMNDRI